MFDLIEKLQDLYTFTEKTAKTYVFSISFTKDSFLVSLYGPRFKVIKRIVIPFILLKDAQASDLIWEKFIKDGIEDVKDYLKRKRRG